jgi:hypothetical protein
LRSYLKLKIIPWIRDYYDIIKIVRTMNREMTFYPPPKSAEDKFKFLAPILSQTALFIKSWKPFKYYDKIIEY